MDFICDSLVEFIHVPPTQNVSNNTHISGHMKAHMKSGKYTVALND